MRRINRREFLFASGALLAGPSNVLARQAGKLFRIGYPVVPPKAPLRTYFLAFEQGLRELGYTPGKDVVIDYRSAEGKPERLPEIIQEILRGKPDVILTGLNPVTLAVKAATKKIPIVMAIGTDVIRAGLIASLARPGGNVTGLTWDSGPGVLAKRIQQLKELVPSMTRLGSLGSPSVDSAAFDEAIVRAGSELSITAINLPLTTDFQRSLEAAVRERVDALLIAGDGPTLARRAELVEVVTKLRLPASYVVREYVESGGLMSYGADNADLYRRAAGYVDEILSGANPADLPVEQPTKFELWINLRAAKALSLMVPQSLLAQADTVIQ